MIYNKLSSALNKLQSGAGLQLVPDDLILLPVQHTDRKIHFI
jgi:hypothetical protein